MPGKNTFVPLITLHLALLCIAMLSAGRMQAQNFRFVDDAIGVLGGYHLRQGANFVELGVSKTRSVHGTFFTGFAFSAELGNQPEGRQLYGWTASTWVSTLLSCGLSTTYYTDFKRARAFSIRPMIGIGILGAQAVYEYDWQIVKPNFDFGGVHRIAFRLSVGLFRSKRTEQRELK